MKAVFYDRKNNCEVSSEELMEINLVESYVVVDDEGCQPGTAIKTITEKYDEDCLTFTEKVVGRYGYKSKNCPTYQNWDKHCLIVDLVFLRLEN